MLFSYSILIVRVNIVNSIFVGQLTIVNFNFFRSSSNFECYVELVPQIVRLLTDTKVDHDAGTSYLLTASLVSS